MPYLGVDSHVLLSRSPLLCIAAESFDLHTLGTPLAFTLNQDQTLHEKMLCSASFTPRGTEENHTTSDTLVG